MLYVLGYIFKPTLKSGAERDLFIIVCCLLIIIVLAPICIHFSTRVHMTVFVCPVTQLQG